ncbi:MAG: GPR endopeptidase [Lachnospiraceae bacterium]|nr:GPR endopeptidase [Lachnospiraceae bacterium]HCJ09417.1 GPR endopeptidase [Lachnospiraceae bacterium]
MRGRTDLAVEMKEEIQSDEPIKGVHVMTKNNGDTDIKEVRIVVENEQGAMQLGKPVGTYITLESEQLRRADEEFHKPMMEVLARHLRQFVGNKKRIMVAGLGNREVTPDALGPFVIDNLYVTRHLLKEGIISHSAEISAIAPGVMAQTGMEAVTVLKALIDEIKPELLIVIDALAARESDRLNKTIQLADTGITPGSGVGNHRNAINEESVGIPVLAIGVPTVIAVPTIVNDAMDILVDAIGKQSAKNVLKKFNEEERYQLACEMVTPYLEDMFVTPKDIDEAVKRISYTISEAINQAVFAA